MIISIIILYSFFEKEVIETEKKNQLLLSVSDYTTNPMHLYVEHQQSPLFVNFTTTEKLRSDSSGMTNDEQLHHKKSLNLTQKSPFFVNSTATEKPELCTPHVRISNHTLHVGSLAQDDGSDGYWQHLQCPSKYQFNLYAYSAYYDDREIVYGQPAAVRVFVGATQLERYNGTLTCLIQYQTNNGTQRYVRVAVATSVMGLGINKQNVRYINYLISCNLSTSHHHLGTPTSVYIACAMSAPYPRIKLPVQLPDKTAVKRKIAVCVCASYDYVDPLWLIEWVELHRMLGVDKIFTYNKSLDDRSSEVLQHYVKEGLVDLKQTRPFFKLEGRDGAQLHKTPTINDCMYRNMHSFYKLVVIDFDEVIVPRHFSNYNDFLIQLDNDYPKSQQFVFQNAFFYLEFPPNKSNSNQGLTTLTHTARQPTDNMDSVKTIINPLTCIKMHNHYCWLSISGAEKDIESVNMSVALKHHYKKCVFRKERENVCKDIIKSDYVYDSSIYRFKDQLISSVETRKADIYS